MTPMRPRHPNHGSGTALSLLRLDEFLFEFAEVLGHDALGQLSVAALDGAQDLPMVSLVAFGLPRLADGLQEILPQPIPDVKGWAERNQTKGRSKTLPPRPSG